MVKHRNDSMEEKKKVLDDIEIILEFIDRRCIESKNEEVKVTLLAIKSRLVDLKQKLKD